MSQKLPNKLPGKLPQKLPGEPLLGKLPKQLPNKLPGEPLPGKLPQKLPPKLPRKLPQKLPKQLPSVRGGAQQLPKQVLGNLKMSREILASEKSVIWGFRAALEILRIIKIYEGQI